MARETHAADLRPGHQTKIQHVFSYSDGFRREIQKKAQAEPGPLNDGGLDVNPRWVGSGWTIYNNKGKPVRQYEPFFSVRPSFEFANTVGVSSILFYDPGDRVVATLHPNHTYEKVVFDPWRQDTWDANDTVLKTNPADDPDVGDFFAKLADSDYLPTWYEPRRNGQLGREEQQVAVKTAVHANTPTTAQFDSLGRTFLGIAHNRFEREGVPIDQYFATRIELDIENNQRAVIDALGRVVMRYDYDMLNRRLRQISVDSGTRWMFNDVVGKLRLMWDSRGYRFRHEYDAVHRPTDFYVRTGHDPELLAERLVYGEGQPHDLALNLRAKPFRQFDGAGIVTNEHYDFKGNLLRSSRRLLEEYKSDVNWAQPPQLESQIFETATQYDALNRRIALTTPDASVARPRYNEANLLESLSVNLRGAQEATPFVTFINYNARGQRTIIDYGNDLHTRYDYDSLTFRLIHLKTRRSKDDEQLQDLHYTFDPVGNITSIRDHAQETVYFKNHVVSASNEYVYDAIYRLISAEGREHAGRPCEPQTTYDDVPRMNYPLPSDGHALHRYREHYEYDAVGNILKLLHSAPNGNWSREYRYDDSDRPGNNRLTSTQVGQWKEFYFYDQDGNIIHMPHLPRMDWDFKDQLHATRQQASNSGRGETTYYVYNSAGQRVRKVTERASGSRKHERVYLGSFEVYRKYDSVGTTTLERETLQVMDEKRRIALVETKTIDDERHIGEAAPHIRFQFDNHLGSSVLELDHHARIISYEEYYPYGSTSFEAAEIALEVSKKRYRYTGKERDEETGFYYYGARYYAPWLGRWTACDPAGLVDGLNVYRYARDNPVRMQDPKGTQSTDESKGRKPEDKKARPESTTSRTLDPATAKKVASAISDVFKYEATLRYLQTVTPNMMREELRLSLIDLYRGFLANAFARAVQPLVEGPAPPTKEAQATDEKKKTAESKKLEFDTQDPGSKGFHLDVQLLGVGNLSPKGQPAFPSIDTQVTLPLKDYALLKYTPIPDRLEISAFHEPALGVTESLHLKDPSDKSNVTGHTQFSAQVDVLDIDIKKGEHDILEFKATLAGQYDAYSDKGQGQVQLGAEAHINKSFSIVGQAQFPFDTSGFLPPSYGGGVLLHF